MDGPAPGIQAALGAAGESKGKLFALESSRLRLAISLEAGVFGGERVSFWHRKTLP